MITRKKLLERLHWTVLGGFASLRAVPAFAGRLETQDPPKALEAQAGDRHAGLTARIASLAARGGGTLELGDGVYEISRTLRLPREVSLVMTPNAVIRAQSGFQGEAVIVKGGGQYSAFSATAGWIRGGVIDGNRQPLTGILVEELHRLEIADLSVLNALHKGIHLLKGGNEANVSRVRCDVDASIRCAPGSIGVHVERSDCKFTRIHVIGYETGVRSDSGSNWFSQVHVWNTVRTQGAMKHCFYCNGSHNAFNQCYADSPALAGFYIARPQQSIVQCRVLYSRFSEDNAGAAFLIAPEGKDGTYIGNSVTAEKGHRLAMAFSGELDGACILNTGGPGIAGGIANQIPSGSSSGLPPLHFAGSGVRLTPQPKPPEPHEGEPGELRWVDDPDNSALWLKTPRGWKKAVLA
jgi:hypothetical protein